MKAWYETILSDSHSKALGVLGHCAQVWFAVDEVGLDRYDIGCR